MPLPRLQVLGDTHESFLYTIGQASAFDPTIRLQPQVGDQLVQLNGLLRPLIQRKWTAMVAGFNAAILDPEGGLEQYLFGAIRSPTERLRGPLWEIDDKACFYCEGRVGDPVKGELDHFLPWARYPDDGIDNLVLAHPCCNAAKRAFLAAAPHVTHWADRLTPEAPAARARQEVAAKLAWAHHPTRTLAAARGLYLRLPRTAKLWLQGKSFVAPDLEAIRTALAPWPKTT
jgi:hypothetical protein